MRVCIQDTRDGGPILVSRYSIIDDSCCTLSPRASKVLTQSVYTFIGHHSVGLFVIEEDSCICGTKYTTMTEDLSRCFRLSELTNIAISP